MGARAASVTAPWIGRGRFERISNLTPIAVAKLPVETVRRRFAPFGFYAMRGRSRLTRLSSEPSFLNQYDGQTSVGCISRPVMVSSAVKVLDVQVTGLVSCRMLPHSSQARLFWNMFDALTRVPSPTFRSVVYLVWSGVALGFGRGVWKGRMG